MMKMMMLRPLNYPRRIGVRNINHYKVDKQVLKIDCQCFYDEINQKLPTDTKLDKNEELPVKTPEYHRHVLLLSPGGIDGKTWLNKWGSKIELNQHWPYSAINTLKAQLRKYETGYGILVNAVALLNNESFIGQTENTDEDANFFVVPDMTLYNVNCNQINQFAEWLASSEKVQTGSMKLTFEDYLNNTSHPTGPILESKTQFKGFKDERDWFLVCGHTQRDPRCGLIAPKLIDKFVNIEDSKNYNVGIISHIGGHKYAGNVIIYKNNHQSGIDALWFGKVIPQTVKLLFDNLRKGTILGGLFRGGFTFNHSKKQ